MDDPTAGPLDCCICNKRGLHARAARKFVECAQQFECDILVSRDDQAVSGLSIMGLLMLGAAKDTFIRLQSSGPDALKAISALQSLIANGFGENE